MYQWIQAILLSLYLEILNVCIYMRSYEALRPFLCLKLRLPCVMPYTPCQTTEMRREMVETMMAGIIATSSIIPHFRPIWTSNIATVQTTLITEFE